MKIEAPFGVPQITTIVEPYMEKFKKRQFSKELAK